jgi:hypothetical protein
LSKLGQTLWAAIGSSIPGFIGGLNGTDLTVAEKNRLYFCLDGTPEYKQEACQSGNGPYAWSMKTAGSQLLDRTAANELLLAGGSGLLLAILRSSHMADWQGHTFGKKNAVDIAAAQPQENAVGKSRYGITLYAKRVPMRLFGKQYRAVSRSARRDGSGRRFAHLPGA